MANHVVQVILLNSTQIVCVPDETHAHPGDTIKWISTAGKHVGSFDIESPLPDLPAGTPWQLVGNTFETIAFPVGNFIGRFKYHVTLTATTDSGEEFKFFADPVVHTERPV